MLNLHEMRVGVNVNARLNTQESSMVYVPRVIENSLSRYLGAFSVIGITGPRQSGKSTLLKEKLQTYQYVNFDDPTMTMLFEDDPVGFMKVYNDRVIFDEAQYVPELFRYIKMAVDNDRDNYGKFVMTGSAQFSMMQNITESLAGRVGLLSLLPFQYSEIPAMFRQASIYRGAYPELVQRGYIESDLWYGAYIDTYLNKDVRNMSQIGDLRDFQRLVSLLAANVSSTLNLSTYATDIGVSVPTIKRWISILEASYIIFLLPPYFENKGKRIVKSPKIYFYDTGLVSYLTGIKNQELYEKGPMSGQLYENYMISEILKKERHTQTQSTLYYLRTSTGQEVDLIIDRKSTKEWIEIKKSATFRPKMLESIKAFMGNDDTGWLLYCGESMKAMGNVQVKNYADYLA